MNPRDFAPSPPPTFFPYPHQVMFQEKGLQELGLAQIICPCICLFVWAVSLTAL